ncbi:DUF2815 family protein [Acinetobacter sp. ANC 4641]|uniref:DUF2815 family protein n=1 Tax=Acinetobacter sp. ANC 4641 TaxID=2529847 RepID=UPI00103F8EB8|nr:DUF2815 family protein [Acinetobacter sp. ANC 4641]TCB12646.1 DUF2815 family protein [Acinetobacter sp. ANC 4641]
MKVKLSNVRLAFPKLFKAESVNGGEPTFSAAFLFAADHSAVKDIKAAIDKVGEAKWGAKWAQIKKGLEAQDKMALHDGDTKADLAGYEGNLFINASNKTRPLIIDRDKTPLDSADGKPYAGCYVNASIELWAQDNSFGKRVNASLRGVQFLKDGDAFAGGGAASDDEFDDLATDDLAEDPAFA